MVFTVNISADLFQVKENIGFEFLTRPSMIELSAACEAVYDIELRARRRKDSPDVPFKVQLFQYFDEVTLEWSELYNQLQLTNCCQVFAFQPTSTLHSDQEGPVPAPRNVVTWLPHGEIERCVIPCLNTEKRREWVYNKLSSAEASHGVTFWDLKNIFSKILVSFTHNPVTDLFDTYDRDRDGRLNKQEWALFDTANPGVVDMLYFKLNDLSGEHPTVLEVLDDAIEQEKMALRDYARREKEQKAKDQQAAISRLFQGKSSRVTSTEVKKREEWIARLADEAKQKEYQDQQILQKIEDEKNTVNTEVHSPLRNNNAVGVEQEAMQVLTPLASLPGMPRPKQPKSPFLKKGVVKPTTPTSTKGSQSVAQTPRTPLTPRQTTTSSTACRHTPQALDSLKKGYSFAPPGTSPLPVPRKISMHSPMRAALSYKI